MTDFTPGPWEAKPVVDGNETPLWQIHGGESGSAYVAYVHRFRDSHFGPAYEANAHLIAAAPDLYAVLENILESMEMFGQAGAEHHVDDIKAALAAARGEGE